MKFRIVDGELQKLPLLHNISKSVKKLELGGNNFSSSGVMFKDKYPMIQFLCHVPK